MVRPLTIAHVDAETGFSGGEVQVFLLMEGLRARGHRNVLLCPPGSAAERAAVERGIDVHAVAMRNDLHLMAVPRLARGVTGAGADLVHLHTGRANWLGGLAAAQAGVPALSTRRMDGPVRRHLVNRIVYGRLVRHVVAIAPAVAAQLVAGGVPRARVSVVPSAVDPAALVPRRPREEVRRSLGVGADAVVVLGLARLTRRKGFDVLLEAWARLRDEEAAGESVLWLAGDGEERAALEAQASALGLGAVVRFLGRRDDVADLLAAADVLAMPSRAEGLGIAALEAMAAGRPVVASAVGGLAEAVVDGRTGRLVPPEDPDALAQALRRLLEDRELRGRLGGEGPARVAEGFLPDQMTSAYEALYRRLLAGGR